MMCIQKHQWTNNMTSFLHLMPSLLHLWWCMTDPQFQEGEGSHKRDPWGQNAAAQTVRDNTYIYYRACIHILHISTDIHICMYSFMLFSYCPVPEETWKLLVKDNCYKPPHPHFSHLSMVVKAHFSSRVLKLIPPTKECFVFLSFFCHSVSKRERVCNGGREQRRHERPEWSFLCAHYNGHRCQNSPTLPCPPK